MKTVNPSESKLPIRSTRIRRKVLAEIQRPYNSNNHQDLKQIKYKDAGLFKVPAPVSRPPQKPPLQNNETQPDSSEPQLIHPRLSKFPYKVQTTYTTTSAPRPGLYRHEIETSYHRNATKLKLNEFEDVEAHEKAFYHLWNSFLLKGGNRPVGMLSLYDKLVKFSQQHSADIEKFKLRSVYYTFLLHFRNIGNLNEKQFFELSFMGTDLENKWHGANAPLR